MKKLKVLTFSTLFPSSVRPGHGIFVEARLRELLKRDDVEARIVAPVPWFPFRHPVFGAYAKFAETPRREQHNGLDVLHPRYFLPPKVGMNVAPMLLARGALPALRQVQREGFDFDVIDAHYFYPDGVAAAWLARQLGKPLIISARGSDLNLIGQFPAAQARMLAAAKQADACVGVSQPLVALLRDWGVADSKLHHIPNGVDLTRFVPLPREQARLEVGLSADAQVLLCVGNLLELKGQHLLIEALTLLRDEFPRLQLVLVGEGPRREALTQLAAASGLGERVRLTGALPQAQLTSWYSAADLAALPSSREGMPNAVLEALACGTPVIATAVGAVPSILACPSGGELLGERSAGAIASTLRRWLARTVDRAAVRACAEVYSWDASTAQLHRLLSAVADREANAHA